SPGRGGPPGVGGGTQDRRVDDGERDLAAGGGKKGASDPAAEAAEIAAGGPFPLVRVGEVRGAFRPPGDHGRLSGYALGRRPGPRCITVVSVVTPWVADPAPSPTLPTTS